MNTTARTTGLVRVVGAGLLGASVGLRLRNLGVDVVLADASRTTLQLAVDYGAGRLPGVAEAEPTLVVVAVPPEAVADVVASELRANPEAIVTDVASVKALPLAELRARGVALERYVGSHPLAGRERGGPISARADLFLARPWVICPRPELTRRALQLVEGLALDLGAIPVEMGTDEHDAAVALVSHTPQLVSSLMARRLVDADEATLGLAGGGVRDVTRVAGSAAELWVQILAANAPAVSGILRAYRDDLDQVLAALDDVDAPGARRHLAEALAGGNVGVARIPGKHGHSERYASVVVLIDDRPGQLGLLFAELGELGTNIEDIRLEHSPGAEIGIVEVFVVPEAVSATVTELSKRGWRIAG